MSILVIIAVIVGLRILAGLMTPDEPEPAAPAALPPPPRKPARRRTPPRIPGFPENPEPVVSAADGEVVVHPVASLAKPLPTATVAPTRLAAFLRGREAQRRAFISKEILGRPLSLR